MRREIKQRYHEQGGDNVKKRISRLITKIKLFLGMLAINIWGYQKPKLEIVRMTQLVRVPLANSKTIWLNADALNGLRDTSPTTTVYMDTGTEFDVDFAIATVVSFLASNAPDLILVPFTLVQPSQLVYVNVDKVLVLEEVYDNSGNPQTMVTLLNGLEFKVNSSLYIVRNIIEASLP